MRRVVWGVGFLLVGVLLGTGRPLSHHIESDDSGAPLLVGGLKFSIPESWQKEPAEGPARAAQWQIAPPRGQAVEGGMEVVVIFFGPGVGGSAKDNIDAWAALMTGNDGRAAAPDPQTRQVSGHKITQVLLSGNYAEASPQPGIPPLVKPAYSLLGAVVENPAGNIYWRITGPTPQVGALAPVFAKVLDSLKPQDIKP